MTDKKPLDPKVQDGIAAAVDEYLAKRGERLAHKRALIISTLKLIMPLDEFVFSGDTLVMKGSWLRFSVDLKQDANEVAHKVRHEYWALVVAFAQFFK